MAKVAIALDKTGFDQMIRRVGEAKVALFRPFADQRGKSAVQILRFGPRGIREQFTDETEYRNRSAYPWLDSEAFGRTPAPISTLNRTGRYKSAWLGGPGGKTETTDASLTIGVDRGAFPQVAIHQGRRSSVTVKPKKRSSTRPNDWAMRFYLGMVHGVWLSIKRIKRGLKIRRRRLSVSSDVKKAIALMLRDTTKGKIRKLRLTTQRIEAPR